MGVFCWIGRCFRKNECCWILCGECMSKVIFYELLINVCRDKVLGIKVVIWRNG